jgi:hypothetical protein
MNQKLNELTKATQKSGVVFYTYCQYETNIYYKHDLNEMVHIHIFNPFGISLNFPVSIFKQRGHDVMWCAPCVPDHHFEK